MSLDSGRSTRAGSGSRAGLDTDTAREYYGSPWVNPSTARGCPCFGWRCGSAQGSHFFSQSKQVGRELRLGVSHVSVEQFLSRQGFVDKHLATPAEDPLGQNHRSTGAPPVGLQGQTLGRIGMPLQAQEIE